MSSREIEPSEVVDAELVDPSSNRPVDVYGAVDRHISEDTTERAQRGVAGSTRRVYGSKWEGFATWCAEHNRTALPATPETLTEYIGHLCRIGKGPATVEQAIATIRSVHKHAGHKGHPDTTAALLVLKDHRRTWALNGGRVRQASVVVIDPLRRMVETCDGGTRSDLRDRAIIVLGFTMMARRSELSALNIADLTQTPDGWEVFIRQSKTDQEARGETVAVPYGTHPDTDPVRVVHAWLAALAEYGIVEGALLRQINRHGQIRGRLSGKGISEALVKRARRAVLSQPERYTAHGLRAGGATAAYRAGAPVSSITKQGRWSPDSPTVNKYIRAVDRWTENPMRDVGL